MYIEKALLELLPGKGWRLSTSNPTTEVDFYANFEIQTGVNNNDAVFSNDPADFGITWEKVSAKAAELEAGEPLRLLREVRDMKLAKTDWWAMSDRTMTQAQIDYRQALRDITNTYSSLDDVVWPQEPEGA